MLPKELKWRRIASLILNQRNINTFIYLNEYDLLHYDYDHCDHAQFLIHASLHALGLCPLIYERRVQLLYKFHNLLNQKVKVQHFQKVKIKLDLWLFLTFSTNKITQINIKIFMGLFKFKVYISTRKKSSLNINN